MSREMFSFMEQNPNSVRGLGPSTLTAMEPYAGHHAGGLFVLIGHEAGTTHRVVKMHDSWGPEDSIIVHTYDPDKDEDADETVEHFHYLDAAEALGTFMHHITEGTD